MKVSDFLQNDYFSKHIILIVGNDDYLRRRAEEKITSLIDEGARELNLSFADSSVPISEILNSCATLPFASDCRVLIASGKFGKFSSDEEKSLIKYSSDETASTFLVFSELGGDEAYKNLKPHITVVDCSKTDGAELKRFAVQMAKEKDISVGEGAMELLLRYSDRMLDRVSNELDKLKAYCMGETVTEDDVKELVHRESDYLVYELSNAISDRDGKKTFDVLDSMLTSGFSESALLGVITANFRRLLNIRLNSGMTDGELAGFLGIKEYAVSRNRKIAMKFSQVKLKKITDKLIDLEYGFKSGDITESRALELGIMYSLSE